MEGIKMIVIWIDHLNHTKEDIDKDEDLCRLCIHEVDWWWYEGLITDEDDGDFIEYDEEDALTMSSSHSTFMSPAPKQYLLPGWFSCF